MSPHAARLGAWRAVVMSHAGVTQRVQKALAAAQLPPLVWFELLAAIARSPSGRPRMCDLADWLNLSRGGITKLCDRLEQAGYVERVACDEDRRSLRAKLTPAGEEMLGEMRGVYEAELERLLRALTAREATVIAAALEKLTAGAAAEADDPAGAQL